MYNKKSLYFNFYYLSLIIIGWAVYTAAAAVILYIGKYATLWGLRAQSFS